MTRKYADGLLLKMRAMWAIITTCHERMDELLEDTSEEGDKAFQEICETRDAALKIMVSCMGRIGIDRNTAQTMCILSKYKERMDKILAL